MTKPLGTHALVTGGSRGLGPVIAAALADEGVDLTLVARSESGLAQAAEAIGDRVRVATEATDLRDEAARRSLVARAQERLGPIDVFVNNAAVDYYIRFWEESLEQVREEIETNLVAPLHLAGLLLEGMLARGTGHIVNMASLSGKMGTPYKATYSATKAGILEWSSALREELRGTGIGVSVVMPAVVRDVGVFSRQGLPPPRLAGSVTSARVAKAVVRAIRHDVPETIVSPTPSRPVLAMDALWPRFGNWIVRRTGVTATMRKLASRDGSADDEATGTPAGC